MMNRIKWIGLMAGLLLLTAVATHLAARADEPPAILKAADEQFDKKNYKDAIGTYRRLLEASPDGEKWEHASQRIITCNLRLEKFDEALIAAEEHLARSKGRHHEARAERQLGNLYLTVPNWGTRAGGKFIRGKWQQGIQVRSFQHDKKQALKHMVKARELYAQYDKPAAGQDTMPAADRAGWHNERIECLFDLATIHSRFGIYESWNYFWHRTWAERDDELEETAGETDFEGYYSYGQWTRKRPIGLRVDEAGKPIFASTPESYETGVNDDQKILWLLSEARSMDRTEDLRYTALSYYRQAMLSRTQFGMDRINGVAGSWWDGGAYPLNQQLENIKPWELGDNQAVILAGGKIVKTELPGQWDVLGLLGRVTRDYPKAPIIAQARYSVGLYHQSRQQYTVAVKDYSSLAEAMPESEWVKAAKKQIEQIQAGQVRISGTGVKLPGEPVELQLDYRNASKIWFVARKINHLAYMQEYREETDVNHYYGYWQLDNWHGSFVNGYDPKQKNHERAAKHLGPEVARWSAEVPNDGEHRYAQAKLTAPLKNAGAYLVYAYLKEPPADHADKPGAVALTQGDSRAVYALSDLAIVSKDIPGGNLYYIAHAATGAPVPAAKVEALETWVTWEKNQQKHHRQLHNLTTNEQGLAVLKSAAGKNSSRLHTLAFAQGDRLAWNGMYYDGPYSPSAMASGMRAFCVTDRPVYRPGQTVKFKIWLRGMKNGQHENMPGENLLVEAFDAKGNSLKKLEKATDPYGGVEGELTLGEEPPLGGYQVSVYKWINGRKNHIGGQQFSVEEYKKPEFSVTIKPDAELTRLGQNITAIIKADYYFGGAVAGATVKYKVFREEYRHSYHFPDRWDWLYGEGYGLGWYEQPWFGWWGASMGRIHWAPHWWHGGGGSPVRELVQEASGQLDAKGELKVAIDTRPALAAHPDRDHRYVIKADVRDASRRVISGEGAVKATRQSFYAFVQGDRGYYVPGQDMEVKVRALTPDNKPVKTAGKLTISSVRFGGVNNSEIQEQALTTVDAPTDEEGVFTYKFRYEKSGQLKFHFSAPDKWGQAVEGYAALWVCGRDFDGTLHKFNNLEILTDKRTYQPGEVAHIAINTSAPDSWVLFSDEIDSNRLLSWKLLHLPNKHMTLDIPIKKEGAPNFFLDATTVSGLKVHSQTVQVLVPPEKGVMDVAVEMDKAEYRPGEKAQVKVTAKGIDGKPARAQVALSVFDKSVLYIAGERAGDMNLYFHGNKRHNHLESNTNLYEQFSSKGYVARPHLNLDPLPPSWWGIWGVTVNDWRGVGDEKMNQLQGLGDRTEWFTGYRAGENVMLFEQTRRGRGMDPMQQNAFGDAGLGRPGAVTMTAAKSAGAGLEGAALKDADGDRKSEGGETGGPSMAEPALRQKFADTAFWITTLETDEQGVAKASFDMPDNLTTWKLSAWGMTKETKVGQADAEAVTSKKLLVRLQGPRFFVERDVVVLSANVHNYHPQAKVVQVKLTLPENLMKNIGDTPLTVPVQVPAGGETRVDWTVKVVKEGLATIRVDGLSQPESDAMVMSFPVLVHGAMRQVASTHSLRPGDKGDFTVTFDVPAERRPELTRLEIRYAPSLVGAMLDALPYCLDYPYRSSENTVSRFWPAVLTLKTLQNMGLKLEDLKGIRGRLDEVRKAAAGQHYRTYLDNPIFDSGELQTIITRGLARLKTLQGGDGGWSWWSDTQSDPYFTSYVLEGLLAAKSADVAIEQAMIDRGMKWLKAWEEEKMRDPKLWGVDSQHAYIAFILSHSGLRAAIKPGKDDKRNGDLIERLWEGRDKLPLRGKALLGMALANLKDEARAKLSLQNIMQHRKDNNETQVTWFETSRNGWWHWYNSEIETNATILRLMSKVEPQSPDGARIVKWMLNNRRNGYYWRSTRETTMCVAAMSEYALASGEADPDYTLTLELDGGAVVKTVKINKENFFTFDNRLVLEGVALGSGKHTLKVSRQGKGALYLNSTISYFTLEEGIPKSGHELKVERTYFLLKQVPYQVEVEDSKGGKIKESRLRYERVAIKEGDAIRSGDLVQVELKVTSDNEYTYLSFEDMKPAGMEPVDLRSGGKTQEGFWSHMELRDEKVAFFVHNLSTGEHLLRYRLRAEVPGTFHALPTQLIAVYAPELKANSDEAVIRILDTPSEGGGH